MPLLRSVGGVLGVPRLSVDWSVQTKKSGAVVSSMGVLYTGHSRGRPWKMEALFITGESY